MEKHAITGEAIVEQADGKIITRNIQQLVQHCEGMTGKQIKVYQKSIKCSCTFCGHQFVSCALNKGNSGAYFRRAYGWKKLCTKDCERSQITGNGGGGATGGDTGDNPTKPVRKITFTKGEGGSGVGGSAGGTHRSTGIRHLIADAVTYFLSNRQEIRAEPLSVEGCYGAKYGEVFQNSYFLDHAQSPQTHVYSGTLEGNYEPNWNEDVIKLKLLRMKKKPAYVVFRREAGFSDHKIAALKRHFIEEKTKSRRIWHQTQESHSCFAFFVSEPIEVNGVLYFDVDDYRKFHILCAKQMHLPCFNNILPTGRVVRAPDPVPLPELLPEAIVEPIQVNDPVESLAVVQEAELEPVGIDEDGFNDVTERPVQVVDSRMKRFYQRFRGLFVVG